MYVYVYVYMYVYVYSYVCTYIHHTTHFVYSYVCTYVFNNDVKSIICKHISNDYKLSKVLMFLSIAIFKKYYLVKLHLMTILIN